MVWVIQSHHPNGPSKRSVNGRLYRHNFQRGPSGFARPFLGVGFLLEKSGSAYFKVGLGSCKMPVSGIYSIYIYIGPCLNTVTVEIVKVSRVPFVKMSRLFTINLLNDPILLIYLAIWWVIVNQEYPYQLVIEGSDALRSEGGVELGSITSINQLYSSYKRP